MSSVCLNVSQNCSHYFSGFNDVFNCENSTYQKVIGLVKIASYFTVILPLIFAAIYAVSSLIGRLCPVDNVNPPANQVAQQTLKPQPSPVNDPAAAALLTIPEVQNKNRTFTSMQFMEFFEKNEELEIPRMGCFVLYGIEDAYLTQFGKLIEQDVFNNKPCLEVLGQQINEMLLPIGKKILSFNSATAIDLQVDFGQKAVVLTNVAPLMLICKKTGFLTTSVSNLAQRMIKANRLTLELGAEQSIFFTGITIEQNTHLRSMTDGDYLAAAVKNFIRAQMLPTYDLSLTTRGRLKVAPIDQLLPINQPVLGLRDTIGIRIEIIPANS